MTTKTNRQKDRSQDSVGQPPCDCGSKEASWHGERHGLRQYMCDKCWLSRTRIIAIGRPTHFRPTGKNVSACGIECPDRAAYDGRDTDCILCRRTKVWKRYMGGYMTTTELKANLCAYDPENPHNHLDDYDPEDRPSPRVPGCGCDNCHYGRDRLARLALFLMETLNRI